jgi:hypothetical protein
MKTIMSIFIFLFLAFAFTAAATAITTRQSMNLGQSSVTPVCCVC